jgi:DNA modification methylase
MPELPQSLPQDDVVAETKIICITDPPYGIDKACWDKTYPRWLVGLAFSVADCVAIMPGLWSLPLCVEDFGKRYKWIISGYNKNGMAHGAIGFNNWIPCVVGGNVKHGGQDAMSFVIGREQKYKHPSQKPLPYMKWLIKRLTNPSDTVLDPFMGSGTTLVAAKELGRRAIGIETELKYVKIAIKRLAQEVLPF